MNGDLLRLALAAGIEDGYWDGLGIRRDLGERTARALLAALGHAPDGDAQAQRVAIEDQAFLAPLPPSVVLRSGALNLVIALPEARREESLRWEIALEEGGTLAGEFVPAQLAQVAARTIGARHYGRYRFTLPDAVHPGYHRIAVPALGCASHLIVGPARCHVPEALQQGGRCWGLAVQLYSLRSGHDWGIGDFGDLAVLARAAGEAGAAFIGLNPLHARHLAWPEEASPYSPSSRLFLDPLYIAVAEAPGYFASPAAQRLVEDPAFSQQLAAARHARLVDYAAVTALKLPVLRTLHHHFRNEGDGAARAAFAAFCAQGGAALARFAEFEALRLAEPPERGRSGPWRDWSAEWREAHSAVRQAFREAEAEAIEFQCWLQWVAATQLDNAAAAAHAAGMRIGLYRDLAVGAARDSAETWSDPELFAPGISVGAPPDMLNRQGQSWGLPPWNPPALAQQGYLAFRQLLAANMRAAGALRIDHVMALLRLFWIPDGMSGAEGGYVRNAFEDLVTILALESTRHRCMVIGEDLGSVPEGLRPRLSESGLLSYRVLIYERHWQGDGSFCHPHEYPPQSLATVATHDMAPLAEFWAGGDVERRAQLDLYPGPDQAAQHLEDRERRSAERAGLLRLLAETGLSPADPQDVGAVIEALHAEAGRTHSMLAAVQIDDVIGEVEPVNVPGTYREYPNWRRKLALPIEGIVKDARWLRLGALMREAGRN